MWHKQHQREQAELVEKAIAEAEAKADVEILPILLWSADSYPQAGWRFGAGFALATSIATYLMVPQLDGLQILGVQVLAFLLGMAATQIPALRRLCLTNREMEEEFSEQASRLFQDLVLGKTKDSRGILVLVSLLEHRVAVRAEAGISEKLGDEALFVEAIATFRNGLGQGESPYLALAQTVTKLGQSLSAHFPIDPNRPIEPGCLPNNLR